METYTVNRSSTISAPDQHSGGDADSSASPLPQQSIAIPPNATRAGPCVGMAVPAPSRHGRLEGWRLHCFGDFPELKLHLENSIHGGSPKWMICRENPNLKWMMTRGTPIYGNPHFVDFPAVFDGEVVAT